MLHASFIGQKEGDVEWPLCRTLINHNSMHHKEEQQGLISMHVDSMQQRGQEDTMHPRLSKEKYGSDYSNASNSDVAPQKQWQFNIFPSPHIRNQHP